MEIWYTLTLMLILVSTENFQALGKLIRRVHEPSFLLSRQTDFTRENWVIILNRAFSLQWGGRGEGIKRLNNTGTAYPTHQHYRRLIKKE